MLGEPGHVPAAMNGGRLSEAGDRALAPGLERQHLGETVDQALAEERELRHRGGIDVGTSAMKRRGFAQTICRAASAPAAENVSCAAA